MKGGNFMDKKVIKEMNQHINLEFYSGYLYMALSIQMEKMNYKGYSKWLKDHFHEEICHAQDFIEFMQKRDVSAELLDIKSESFDLTDPLEVAKLVLEHERKVTASIYKLHDIVKEYKDYATEIFLHKYIDEQIEEEDLAQTIIDKFTFAGDSTSAKYAVDREFLCN